MKTKFFLTAILCCAVLISCQNNEPENSGNQTSNPEATEISERLQNLFDGLGMIISTETLNDGSVVLKDDKGNTITKDIDGNITIVTENGETIYIDNSINEDISTPKDKWHNTKWVNKHYASPEPDINYRKEEFVQTLRNYGFIVNEIDINKDSIVVEKEQLDNYTLLFMYSTASLQLKSTSNKYTYDRTYHFTQYNVLPETIGDGEIRYRFEMKYSYDSLTSFGSFSAYLIEEHYNYNYESNSYVLSYSDEIDGISLGNDNGIYVEKGYQNNNTKEEILLNKFTTILFNYRRISDTQIAASNNSSSYILKEDNNSSSPRMDAFDLEGQKLITFDIIAF